ncbi:MAG: peptidase domain-containing ABC transporter [Candidatus Cloacimonetes bacterium]|nr:peptidase domain-containing ABC transporter [Candidatus Cloacimonadota bacterium]
MKYQDIQSALNQNDLLNIIPNDEIQKIADTFQVYSFSLGDIILKAGDKAQGFFVVYSGKCRVLDDSGPDKAITLATLQKGDSFGEESLLLNKEISKTIRASSTVIVLKIPAQVFHQLISKYDEFHQLIQQRIQLHDEVNFLRTLQVFSSLNPKDSKLLLDSVQRVSLKEGQFLFEENDPGDAAFIIRKGKVKIVKQSSKDTLIAIIRPGVLIGEMSLLYSRPRSAAALATEDTELLKLSRDQFVSITEKSPNVEKLLNKQATYRLMQEETLLAQGDASHKYADIESLLTSSYKSLKSDYKARKFYCVESQSALMNGVCCISMVAASLHINYSIDQLVDQQILSNKIETLSSISHKLEHLDILTRSLYVDKNKLSQTLLPAIIEDSNGMLHVLYSFDDTGAIVCDPQKGLIHYPVGEFFSLWNQKMISLRSAPNLSKDQTLFNYCLGIFRPYLTLLLGMIVMSMFIHILSLFGPFAVSVLMDEVLVYKDHYLFNSIVLIGLTVMSFQCFAYFLRANIVLHTMRKVSNSITLKFFHYILSLNMKEQNKMQVGDLSSRINENEKLLSLVSNNSINVLSDSFSIFVYLLVLFAIHPTLSTTILVFLVTFLLFFIILSPLIRRQESLSFNTRNNQETFIIDLLNGIKTIKIDASERIFFRNGLGHFYETETQRYKAYELNSILTLSFSLLSNLCFIYCLYMGPYLVLNNEISTGGFLLYYACLAFILIPLKDLGRIWDEFLEIKNSLKRISEVFELSSEFSPSFTNLHTLDGHISLVDVNFQFDPSSYKKTIQDVSLNIGSGEHVSLVGRSGSGKSTLVQLISKLYEAHSGAILLDQRDILSIDAQAIRQQICLVESESWVFSGTIRENLSIAAKEIDFDKIIAASSLTLAHEFIQKLPNKYNTIIGEQGVKLSTGQLQKIALARAILMSPQVLILDEALSALDPESESKVFSNLNNIMKGKTLIYIGSNRKNIQTSDRIYVLHFGRLVESGTHQQLQNNKDMYYHQFCKEL